ncbi:hypothetical protein FOA52_003592 [Chlamydomonas sp. UWO 241]|nr:hypothetical protein FOA52_003592 [Chlamydomonas sp. UWO 241]
MRGGPRATDAQVCAGLRTLEAAVPGLWRLPLLSACKEPIWRLWVWLLQPPAGVRAGVWAVVAALVVDAMERGCRHLWRITRPRDGVLPPDRTVSVERAGALATMDLWNALASFAEGGVMPRADRGQMITIVSAYSPTEAASDEEAGDFYLRVAALADKANDKRDLLIVAGLLKL